jgi:hypothetical protein
MNSEAVLGWLMKGRKKVEGRLSGELWDSFVHLPEEKFACRHVNSLGRQNADPNTMVEESDGQKCKN